MTKHTTSSMRKVFAGITLAGALTVPLAGVAAANGDSGSTRGRDAGSVRVDDGSDTKKSDDGSRRTAGDRTTTTLSVVGLQQVCQERITRRLHDLDRLEAKLAEKADVVTPAHAAAITTIITEARTGLTALGAEIGAATTVDALKPLCARIVTDFRIYALRIPQAGLAMAADALVAKQATFATLRTKLEAAIAADVDPANDAEVAALLAQFDEHVADMVAKASGIADPVLALTPADYNADHKVLKPFVAAAKDARSEAKQAAKTARKILDVLAGEAEDEDGSGWAGGHHDGDK